MEIYKELRVARKRQIDREVDAMKSRFKEHAYSWQQPTDLGDLRPDIDKLLEQKDGVQLA